MDPPGGQKATGRLTNNAPVLMQSPLSSYGNNGGERPAVGSAGEATIRPSDMTFLGGRVLHPSPIHLGLSAACLSHPFSPSPASIFGLEHVDASEGTSESLSAATTGEEEALNDTAGITASPSIEKNSSSGSPASDRDSSSVSSVDRFFTPGSDVAVWDNPVVLSPSREDEDGDMFCSASRCGTSPTAWSFCNPLAHEPDAPDCPEDYRSAATSRMAYSLYGETVAAEASGGLVRTPTSLMKDRLIELQALAAAEGRGASNIALEAGSSNRSLLHTSQPGKLGNPSGMSSSYYSSVLSGSMQQSSTSLAGLVGDASGSCPDAELFCTPVRSDQLNSVWCYSNPLGELEADWVATSVGSCSVASNSPHSLRAHPLGDGTPCDSSWAADSNCQAFRNLLSGQSLAAHPIGNNTFSSCLYVEECGSRTYSNPLSDCTVDQGVSFSFIADQQGGLVAAQASDALLAEPPSQLQSTRWVMSVFTASHPEVLQTTHACAQPSKLAMATEAVDWLAALAGKPNTVLAEDLGLPALQADLGDTEASLALDLAVLLHQLAGRPASTPIHLDSTRSNTSGRASCLFN
mmetsp:Transcript_15393/g.43042  ORF Transcript_15393/g.43042 Transcript_15393/m.43042 type:complete len:577 (-) Transcript_15393:819-2549(-)